MYSCESCNKSFSRNSSLLRHLISTAHKNRLNDFVKYYTCGCGKKYSYSQTLYAHKKKCSVINQQALNIELQLKVDKLQHKLNMVEEERNGLQKLIHRLTKSQTTKPDKTNVFALRSNKREPIPSILRHQIKNRQNDFCGICKKNIRAIFQIDHIIALQFGGTNDLDNLMALCCECHAEKTHKEIKCRNEIRAAITHILSSYSIEDVSL